jgi:hypothetical protein
MTDSHESHERASVPRYAPSTTHASTNLPASSDLTPNAPQRANRPGEVRINPLATACQPSRCWKPRSVRKSLVCCETERAGWMSWLLRFSSWRVCPFHLSLIVIIVAMGNDASAATRCLRCLDLSHLMISVGLCELVAPLAWNDDGHLYPDTHTHTPVVRYCNLTARTTGVCTPGTTSNAVVAAPWGRVAMFVVHAKTPHAPNARDSVPACDSCRRCRMSRTSVHFSTTP